MSAAMAASPQNRPPERQRGRGGLHRLASGWCLSDTRGFLGEASRSHHRNATEASSGPLRSGASILAIVETDPSIARMTSRSQDRRGWRRRERRTPNARQDIAATADILEPTHFPL